MDNDETGREGGIPTILVRPVTQPAFYILPHVCHLDNRLEKMVVSRAAVQDGRSTGRAAKPLAERSTPCDHRGDPL